MVIDASVVVAALTDLALLRLDLAPGPLCAFVLPPE